MVICGTGHRPNKLGGYGNETRDTLRELAVGWLQEHKPSEVISGMALGWDQALAWAARELRIKYTAAVPFVGMQDRWPAHSVAEYVDLLTDANTIKYVSPPGYSPYKMQVRNEWMVDRADKVLALWDGSSGGTGNCIRYAKAKDKTIINLWDEYDDRQA